MNWFSTVVGGAFGFLLGGPLGAILGASVGHQFGKGLAGLDAIKAVSPSDQHRIQMAFLLPLFQSWVTLPKLMAKFRLKKFH